MELEPLCQQLGIAEHIPALSEWRDDFLRLKAEEIQQIKRDAATEKEALNAEIASLNEQLQGLP